MGYWVFFTESTTSSNQDNSSSLITHAYYAYDTTFTESQPPSENKLSVTVNENKEIHLIIMLKQANKTYQLVPNVSFTLSQKADLKTLYLDVQKLEGMTNATETHGLDVEVGPRTEWSFAPEIKPGHYLVQATISTVDAVTHKSLSSETLHSSFDYQ